MNGVLHKRGLRFDKAGAIRGGEKFGLNANYLEKEPETEASGRMDFGYHFSNLRYSPSVSGRISGVFQLLRPKRHDGKVFWRKAFIHRRDGSGRNGFDVTLHLIERADAAQHPEIARDGSGTGAAAFVTHYQTR